MDGWMTEGIRYRQPLPIVPAANPLLPEAFVFWLVLFYPLSFSQHRPSNNAVEVLALLYFPLTSDWRGDLGFTKVSCWVLKLPSDHLHYQPWVWGSRGIWISPKLQFMVNVSQLQIQRTESITMLHLQGILTLGSYKIFFYVYITSGDLWVHSVLRGSMFQVQHKDPCNIQRSSWRYRRFLWCSLSFRAIKKVLWELLLWDHQSHQ